MIKLFLKTVIDNNATKNNSHNEAINTAPHAPKSATSTDVENNMSVKQLLDGQEHPVAKVDIIKKGFYCKAAIERCVAYLRSFPISWMS